MRDFSKPVIKEPTLIEFTLDGDVFHAYPNVGAGLIDDLMDLTEFGDLLDKDPDTATAEDLTKLAKAQHTYNVRLANFLDLVLSPESAELYASRLRLAGPKSIERWQSQGVIRFLIEEYSKPHPTGPPSSSTNGRGGSKRSSTATASTGE